MRRRHVFTTMAAMALVAAAVHAQGPGQGGPPVVTIVGQNDVNVDSQAIQDAVDAATKGTKIVLVGEFQLDGGLYVENKWGFAAGASVLVQTSHISISGQRIDNDGDGPANEDPENGIDDDGDGLVDEDGPDAVLKGILDGSGEPADDCAHPNAIAGCGATPADRFFNRGMLLGGNATNVTVSDLRFEGHWRAIGPVGSHRNYEGHYCSGVVPTGNLQSRITIRDNSFHNNGRSFQIYGTGEQFKFHHNDVVGAVTGTHSVLLVGSIGSCALADGTFVDMPMGSPLRTQVADNRISGGRFGITLIHTDSSTVSSNDVSDVRFGILAGDEVRAAILRNTIESYGFLGLDLYGDAQSSAALNNTVVGGCFGLYVDPRGSGYLIVNNDFQGGCGIGVYFDVDSHDNVLVTTDFTTEVIDEGDNVLLGTLAMINNPGVPDDVRDKLAAMRSDLGKP